MSSYKFIIIIAFVFVLLLGIPIGLYFYNFNGNLSANSADWGNIGDFFSGTIGNTLLLFNLFATIGIAYVAWKFNENISKDNQDTQIKLFMSEQRMLVYQDFIKQKNEFINELYKYSETDEMLKILYEKFQRYIENFYLDFSNAVFKINEKEKDKLISVIHSHYLRECYPEEDLFKALKSFIVILKSNLNIKYEE